MNVDPIRQAVRDAVRVELAGQPPARHDERNIRKIAQEMVDKNLEGYATRAEVNGLRDLLVTYFQSSAAVFAAAKIHKRPFVSACSCKPKTETKKAWPRNSHATKLPAPVGTPSNGNGRVAPGGGATLALLAKVRDLLKVGVPIELKLADVAKSVKAPRGTVSLALTRAGGARLMNGEKADHLVPPGLTVAKIVDPTKKNNGRPVITWRLTRTA